MKTRHYAVCVRTAQPRADLEVRKVYEVLVDREAARDNLIRVIDGSGEDYLYPAAWFVPIRVPPEAAAALAEALST